MTKDPRTIADFTATLPNGEATSLADRLGKVVLVVNTASKCGFTPQYEGLEALWRKYRDQGFEVIAFPCNQFGKQEPGEADEIAAFCSVNFGLSFPLMDKVEVNGADAAPLYRWLKAEAPGLLGSKSIKWNFTKFLIDREGRVVRRYAPTDKPAALEQDIEKQLSASRT
ncbi:glutathione peroxidase [Novosphingobium resinovorum]|uniref:glutathione peroxidase n=1 Tax=Novosphingobium resinovorum TaxID=158500 RepID=UPI002ED3011E|nr:glutathione peroxidase [Novosphingobium resinovorum]